MAMQIINPVVIIIAMIIIMIAAVEARIIIMRKVGNYDPTMTTMPLLLSTNTSFRSLRNTIILEFNQRPDLSSNQRRIIIIINAQTS